MCDWEAQFRDWAKPPSKTEEDRCSNAVSAIRNAIKACEKLSNRGVSIFTQGSYRNNTNVREESDVDIGILCGTTYLNHYPEGTTRETFGFIASDYNYLLFKNEVEAALVAYFGRPAITRGNKALDIHETNYHVEADVAAFFTHRKYINVGKYYEGVSLYPDKSSELIINWPEQHYTNGCQMNTATGLRYKSIVRVLKALSNEMTEQHVNGGDLPGFLIECLVGNVPNDRFQNSTYTADLKAVLIYLYEQTKNDDSCREWCEVSGLKVLFRPDQKWTRMQANAFIYAAWNHVGLGGQT